MRTLEVTAVSEHKEIKEEQAPRQPLRKRIKWDVVALAVSAVALYGLSLAFPEKGERAMVASWEFFKEMAFVLPALMILMGLFAIWVDRRIVVKYLGKGSGTRGLFLAIVLGAGRRKHSNTIDPLAGMLVQTRIGDRISRGDLLVSLFSEKKEALDQVASEIRHCFSVLEEAPVSEELPQLLYEHIH